MTRRAHDLMEVGLELARIAAEDEGPPPTVVVGRTGDDVRYGAVSSMIPGRLDRAPSELAVLLTAMQPVAAAMVVGVSVRTAEDLDVGRRALVVGIDRTGGGHRMDACMAPWEDGLAGPVAVASAPTSSLLFDAVVRANVRVGPLEVAAVLDARGHRLLVPVDTDPGRLVPQEGRLATPGQAIHAVDRLAREFDRRHCPSAPPEARGTAPGVPCDAPPGWEAACAI